MTTTLIKIYDDDHRNDDEIDGLMKIVMTYGVDLELLGKSTKRRELNRQEERREKGENNTKVI